MSDVATLLNLIKEIIMLDKDKDSGSVSTTNKQTLKSVVKPKQPVLRYQSSKFGK